MLTVSSAFTTALSNNHIIATKCEVLTNGSLNTSLPTLSVTDGQVRVDVTQSVRRRCELRLTDFTGTITPSTADDILTPYGTELKLYRGLSYKTLGTTSDELVPLGVFRISSVEVHDSGDGYDIQIEGYDRSRAVQRAKLKDVYVIPNNTDGAAALQALISSGVPGLDYNFTTSGYTLPKTILDAGQDRWEAAMRIADAMAMEIFFDPNGICVLRAVPDPDATIPVATYQEGLQTSLAYVMKNWSDEGVFSHVIVTGEATDNSTPVRAEWIDTDPTSPTYAYGPFGDVPIFLVSPLIKSQVQAQAVADNRGKKITGAAEQVFIDILVNPALQERDGIRVVRTKSKVNATYITESMTIPMSYAQLMPITCRRRRLV